MVSTPPDPVTYDPAAVHRLVEQFALWSAETYAPTEFPHREINALRQAGLLQVTLAGEPLDQASGNTAGMLRLLTDIGRGNLAVGRLYEGHLNALQLIHLYGDSDQQARWFADARAGHLFGVWNTQANDGVRLYRQATGGVLMEGCKTFCSGSVNVTRPIVTGVLYGTEGDDRGWQMSIPHLEEHSPPVDTTGWSPLGMQASVSYRVDFTGLRLTETQLLGAPADYMRQPWFSGGAIRFAAVQLGGAVALLEGTRRYLRNLDRTGDAHQRSRVARMVMLVEGARLYLERAGRVTDRTRETAEIVHFANLVRATVANCCSECLQLTADCVGARGMLHPHPFARVYADLTMYLRQPAPDATLEAIAQHYLDGPRTV